MTVSQRPPIRGTGMRQPMVGREGQKPRTAANAERSPRRPGVGRKRARAEGVLVVVLLLLIGTVLFVGGMMLFSSFLTVEEIAVVGTENADAILAAAALPDDLKLYEVDKDGTANAILRANPYIESVEVRRVLPNRIEFVCTPREAAYYTEVAGAYFALSVNLCVLEQAENAENFAERGLVQLILPEIRSAVVSRPLLFAGDFDAHYLTDLLAAHRTSALFADTDLLRVENRFDVRMIVRENFALTLGESDDAELKLKLAERILQDATFAGPAGAFLDLRDPKQVTAILDKQTDYTLLWRD